MLLSIAGQLDSVGRSLDSGQNRSMNTLFVTANRSQSQMRAVTDCPQTDLFRAKCLSQGIQIVGALISVVAVEIDPLLTPGLCTSARLLFEKTENLFAIGG